MQLGLDLDPTFKDFNFSLKRDPTMRKGPTEAELIALVYRGQLGDIDALSDLADAMFYTMRPEAFDAYQRFQGPLGISHREWYYAKLQQFFKILICGTVSITGIIDDKFRITVVDLPIGVGFAYINRWGDIIQPDEIQEALAPEDNDPRTWLDLAKTVSKVGTNRLQLAQDWLGGYRKRRTPVSSPRRAWAKNQERDNIIRNCLSQGMDRADICRELDKRTISTIPALEQRGIHRWVEGWADPQGRNSIQSLISKQISKKLSSPH